MIIGAGEDKLTLKISEDPYQGDAQYTVSVDGVQIGGILTAKALHNSGQSDTVDVLGNWAPGSHNAQISFINDLFGGTAATDRNLYVDGATYNGVAVTGAAQSLHWSGPGNFGFTEAALPVTTIGAGEDKLTLKISQDPYQGDAQYTVSVDGVQIGGILTAKAVHNSGQSDTVDVLGNWAPGSHNAQINFINDLFGGTAATDRNLYVDGATYNGVAVTGAAQSLHWSGPGNFGFTEAVLPHG